MEQQCHHSEKKLGLSEHQPCYIATSVRETARGCWWISTSSPGSSSSGSKPCRNRLPPRDYNCEISNSPAIFGLDFPQEKSTYQWTWRRKSYTWLPEVSHYLSKDPKPPADCPVDTVSATTSGVLQVPLHSKMEMMPSTSNHMFGVLLNTWHLDNKVFGKTVYSRFHPCSAQCNMHFRIYHKGKRNCWWCSFLNSTLVHFAILSFVEMAKFLHRQPGVKFLYSERFCQDPLRHQRVKERRVKWQP